MTSIDSEPRGRLGLGQLFLIFFKAGCAFGGGLALLGILEQELVVKRRLLPREELLVLWGIGRIVPCGTMTAVTVALGYRLCGHRGVVAGLAAVVLPGFLCTVPLAAAYGILGHGPALAYVSATLLPAALAFIVLSAFRLGREIFRPSPELVLAVGAFAAFAFFDVSPTWIIIGGGLIGAAVMREPGERAK